MLQKFAQSTAVSTIGIDLGKNSFHLVGLDQRGAIVLQLKCSRAQLERRLANIPCCLIGMEACCGAHYIARQLATLGHDVRLLPAQYVKPFLKGHKNDYRDAEAIAEAVQRPTMHFVAIKTPEQMDLLALHRVRSRLVGQRTGMINQIRGFLIERGITVRQGVAPLRRALPDILSANTGALSPRMVNLISELVQDWRRLDERIAAVSAEIESLAEQDQACQRVMTVPGVGPIISSAVVPEIARSWARSPSAATSICGHCSCRPRTLCWRGGRMQRCAVCGLGSSRHRGGCTVTCWRSHSPTSSPASPGRFSRAVAPISRESSPSEIKLGKQRPTNFNINSFPAEVCEME